MIGTRTTALARLSLCLRRMREENTHPDARLLRTLEELLALDALDVADALMAATQRIVEALSCDKVDVFLLDSKKQTLRALGTSDTPMGRRQRELGLDILPLANGGRAVEVFKTGATFVDGHAEQDDREVRGIVEELGVRSSLNVAFQVDAARRGVVSAVSAQPDFFRATDVRFLEAVAHWIGALTHRAELAESARKAEADRARRMAADEIITVLAHDLRNHLHPLSSRLHVMRLQSLAGKGAQTADIDAALLSVSRITRLANDLLDMKRLDEGLFSLNLGPVDLAHVVRETAGSFATASVRVSVTGREELVVVADGDRLRQAIENLVSNAVHYSPPGRAVGIALGVQRDVHPSRAVLEVSDAGPGISPDVLPALFEPFASGPGSKGIGLGLYLSRQIARAHGGDVTAHSQLGAGTTFRVVLPLESPPERPQA